MQRIAPLPGVFFYTHEYRCHLAINA
jgi:hypothetical protein